MVCVVRWGSSLRRDRLRSVVDGDGVDNVVGKCRTRMIVDSNDVMMMMVMSIAIMIIIVMMLMIIVITIPSSYHHQSSLSITIPSSYDLPANDLGGRRDTRWSDRLR
jgi:hypothetical protein